MKRFAVLPLCLLVASCGVLDTFRPSARGDTGGSLVQRDAAERACVAAAEAQGFAFVNRISSQPLAGPGGVIAGRLITMNIAAGGEPVEIGCTFDGQTGAAVLVTA